MWGALIGLAGQAVSGVASAINNRKIQQAADNEAARQEAYYTAKANEDPLSRSENAQVLGAYDRAADRAVQNAHATSKILGRTNEYELGVQSAQAEGRADLMGNISAGASQRADRYNNMAEHVRHQKSVEDQQRRAERNQTYAALAANAANAAGAIMDAYQPKTAEPANTPPDIKRLPHPDYYTDRKKYEQGKIQQSLAKIGSPKFQNPMEEMKRLSIG